ncbi:hypothetical protein J2I48_26155 [Fibrella sp. HMF5036]|uniref:DUF5723 domain-containing protein n=1 Tax=Fibrella aquatilis TaxID=2817059 RepID=A0A939GD66_9BACT|nr:hypothetical protein [Fibrella aquatilis]
MATLCLLPALASAQNLLGLTTSPTSGVHRTYQNPAWLADSPHRVFVSLGAGNLHANNNYVRYQAPFSLLRLITGQVPDEYRRSNGNIKFESTYTQETLDDKPKNATVWGDFRGPALQLAVGNRTVIGLSSRLRVAGQVWGASEQLLSALRASLNSSAFYSIPSRNNAFSVSTNTYAELAASVGHTVLETDEAKLMVGLTIKYLVGFTSGYFVNRGLTYQVLPDANVPSGGYLSVDQVSADFGYTSFLQNQNLTLRSLVNGHPPGRGVGFDLGGAYVYKPDPDGATLRAGIALTDLGGINYTADAYAIDQQKLRFFTSDFNDVRNSEQIVNVIRQKLRVEESQNQGSFTSGLPSSLNTSVDYELPTGLGLQMAYWQDLRSNSAVAMHQPSVVALVPRYEHKWAAVSVPISLVNGAVLAGLSLRAGPIWLGSDNVPGLFGNSSNGIAPRGLDVYGGIAFGFGSRGSTNE